MADIISGTDILTFILNVKRQQEDGGLAGIQDLPPSTDGSPLTADENMKLRNYINFIENYFYQYPQ